MTTKFPISCWTKTRNDHEELEANEDLSGAMEIIEEATATNTKAKEMDQGLF